ncbi:MAG: hypothetical protein NTV87_02040 [Ignavibacteriae bacterium]|jgi:hypothetical protein|nr:hypothetical protein [Ignavibacteriota bacterium]
MFEEIIDKKLKTALDALKSSVAGSKVYSAESVNKSGLSEFIKTFVAVEAKEELTREYLYGLIEKAVKLNLNYTLRPKWTLLNFLFGNIDSKPAKEILRKAEVFQFYLYYIDGVRSFGDEESQLTIMYKQVESMLNETDRIIYDKLINDITSLKLKNFFLQIFRLKYGEEKEISLDMYVPFIFIRLYLEDKGFTDLLKKFSQIDDLKDDTDVELKTIIKIFTGKYKYYTKETARTSPGNSPAEKSASADSGHQQENINDSESGNSESGDSVIEFINDIPEAENVQENFYSRELLGSEEEKNELLTEIIGNEDKKELRIKRLFKEDELNMITKRIFKSNRYTMYEVFEELENLRDWREATEYLKGAFKKNKVNLYDKGVILFVDILNDYFERRQN